MGSVLDASNLFSVKGQICVITGGGTGEWYYQSNEISKGVIEPSYTLTLYQA